MTAAIYQINKSIQHLHPKKLVTLMTSWHKMHQHDHRLRDGCFQKKLEIHVSNSLSNKQKKS